MQGLREFKAIWDPDGRNDPGKLIDAFLRPKICASAPTTVLHATLGPLSLSR